MGKTADVLGASRSQASLRPGCVVLFSLNERHLEDHARKNLPNGVFSVASKRSKIPWVGELAIQEERARHTSE